MQPSGSGLTQVLFDVPPVLVWLAGIGWFALVGLITYIWMDQRRQVVAAHSRIDAHEKIMQERFERIESRMSVAVENVASTLAKTREDYVPRVELQRGLTEIAAGQARIEKILEALSKSFRHERLNTSQRLVALEATAGIAPRITGPHPDD